MSILGFDAMQLHFLHSTGVYMLMGRGVSLIPIYSNNHWYRDSIQFSIYANRDIKYDVYKMMITTLTFDVSWNPPWCYPMNTITEQIGLIKLFFLTELHAISIHYNYLVQLYS